MQQDSSIELTGTLEFRDLLKFQCFHYFRRAWWLVLPMTLVSFAGVLLAILVVVLGGDVDSARENGTPFLLVLILWIFILTLPYWAAKRQMRTNIPLSSPITCRFSQLGIDRSGTYFSSQLSYEALWKVLETKSMYLLYLGAGAAIMVPKRFFKDATQENDWRNLMASRISPKKIAKPGLLGRWI